MHARYDPTQLAVLAARLVETIKNRRAYFRTNEVMVLIGDDFRFEMASSVYAPMDAVIAAVNAGTATHGVYGAHFSTGFCTRGCHWIPRMFA
jgi:hypothetical protein